jgi:uncharacterized membrane protein YphA (DoxX/SURF4 family)
MKLFHIILRIILGIIFISSSILKLISIDEFDMYVFSFKLFSLDFSALITRLVIGFELAIGILLVLNVFYKQLKIVSISILSFFAIFLIYNIIIGDNENCHCFGESIKMNPIQSLIKNVFLIFLFLVNKQRGSVLKYQKITLITAGLLSLSAPLIFYPPDFIYPELYSDLAKVNEEKLNEYIINSSLFPNNLTKGKVLLNFYSPECHFCQLAEKKISTIVMRNNIDTSKVLNIIWGDSSELKFLYNSKSIRFKCLFLKRKEFLSITKGNMPLILLLENSVVKEKFCYRNIEEERFVEFLKIK